RSGESCGYYDGRPFPPCPTLSLHDALPISSDSGSDTAGRAWSRSLVNAPAIHRSRYVLRKSGISKWRNPGALMRLPTDCRRPVRSEEHTSELQSQSKLVCLLLLEKKKLNTA